MSRKDDSSNVRFFETHSQFYRFNNAPSITFSANYALSVGGFE